MGDACNGTKFHLARRKANKLHLPRSKSGALQGVQASATERCLGATTLRLYFISLPKEATQALCCSSIKGTTMATPPPTLSTILITFINPSHKAVLLTYNQPHISNAFTLQQYHDLATALSWAQSHASILVVVLTGAGKNYCAGKVLQSPDEGGPTIDQEIAAGSALGKVLQGYPKILIAAVNGAAVGWGCTQLWHFDLVYASEKAFFQTPFTRLGFVPEGGSSWSFPRVMGRQRAMRLLLASDRVPAADMQMSGLVTEVMWDDGDRQAFLKMVCEKASTISHYPEESLRLVKELTDRSGELEEMRLASERERKALSRVLSGDAAKQAMSAFGKRKKADSKL